MSTSAAASLVATQSFVSRNRFSSREFFSSAIIDPVPARAHDAENHLISTGGVTYTYDGDGRRVTKSSGTIYSYLPTGEVLMESSLSNGYEQFFYYYFNGQRVGNTNNLNALNEYAWYFTDHLGSTRFYWQWDGDGGWNRSDFYPFGAEVVIQSDEPSHFKFTGKERDSESGLDNLYLAGDERTPGSPVARIVN
jgi:hypothetical protein